MRNYFFFEIFLVHGELFVLEIVVVDGGELRLVIVFFEDAGDGLDAGVNPIEHDIKLNNRKITGK